MGFRQTDLPLGKAHMDWTRRGQRIGPSAFRKRRSHAVVTVKRELSRAMSPLQSLRMCSRLAKEEVRARERGKTYLIEIHSGYRTLVPADGGSTSPGP